MLDEALLDRPEELARADERGLLLGVAAAGARVRTAVRLAEEAGLKELQPDGRPRTVLVAAPAWIGETLAALAGGSCPVLPLIPSGPSPEAPLWALPAWIGPLDLVLVATGDGREQGLTSLVEQAYRSGCTVVGVAPAESPLDEAIHQTRGWSIPYAAPRPDVEEDHGVFWALFAPLAALADRLGLCSADLTAMADRLDEVAARCGPAVETYTNPAKTLATELTESLPLIWSEGAVTTAVAGRFADLLVRATGRAALTAELPRALETHRSLLKDSGPDDFFRDRLEDGGEPRPRVVLLQEAGRSPVHAARELTNSQDTPLSEIVSAEGGVAEGLAELLLFTDFVGVYLEVASGERP